MDSTKRIMQNEGCLTDDAMEVTRNRPRKEINIFIAARDRKTACFPATARHVII